jgi:hypothetical protein
VFGEMAQYTHKEKHPVVTQINGVFDKHPVELGDDGRGILVSSVSTSFSILLEDLKFPPQEGDEIQIRGVQYRVMEIQEESSGVTAKLILMKATHA